MSAANEPSATPSELRGWALILAVFQPHAYLAAARSSAGGVRFLVRWIGTWVGLSAVLGALLLQLAMPRLQKEIAAVPDLVLEDGRLTFNAPQPWQRDVEGGLLVAVDTTGATRAVDLPARPQVVLLTADRVVVRDAGGEREVRYANFGKGRFTRADLAATVRILPLVLLAAGLFLFGWWLLVAFFLVFLASGLVTLGSQGRVRGRLAVRMTAHAFAIPMAIGMSPLSFPGLWTLVYGTGALLAWLGGRAVRDAAIGQTE